MIVSPICGGDETMARQTDQLIRTVTVVASKTVGRADGEVALVLVTQELGTIAFRVDQSSIENLRGELSKAEAFLAQPKGSA
jgi:hypothetical protein